MTEEEEKFKAHNWKHLSPHEVKNLPPVQRGRYLAYEEPPKDVLDAQEATLKRIRETYKQKKIATRGKEPVDLGTFLAFICKISLYVFLHVAVFRVCIMAAPSFIVISLRLWV